MQGLVSDSVRLVAATKESITCTFATLSESPEFKRICTLITQMHLERPRLVRALVARWPSAYFKSERKAVSCVDLTIGPVS